MIKLDRRDLLRLSLAGAAASLIPAAAVAPLRAAAAEKGTRWIVLGSKGGPRVTTGRSNPANVLLVDGIPYVVDCGYGVAKRLEEAKVALPSIRYVFVTHLHSDHVLEFGNMVYSAWSAGLITRSPPSVRWDWPRSPAPSGSRSISTSRSACPTRASLIRASCSR